MLPYETIMKGTIMKENELTYELICAAVNGDREALDQILIEQNRCAMAYQGCGIAIFCFL